MTEDFGRDTPPYTTNEETKTAGQPLSDFLLQLEDYTPTVSKQRIGILIGSMTNILNYAFNRYQTLSVNITCILLVLIQQIPECKQFAKLS